MKCGDKWNRTNKCPTTVPLHVLEELCDAVNTQDSSDDVNSNSSSDEEVLSLSLEAMEGLQGKKTTRIQGLINKQEVLILIDSGSSSTFISNTATQKLGFAQQQAPGVTVTVADGGVLKSNTIIPAVIWWTQGHTFSAAARVLDIKCYDMILGMDWLEQHSPMWIYWKRKKLIFTYKG